LKKQIEVFLPEILFSGFGRGNLIVQTGFQMLFPAQFCIIVSRADGIFCIADLYSSR